MPPRKSLFIAAGDPSGDLLGASLLRDLKERSPEAYTFWGIGGKALQAEGLVSLFPLEDIALMGVTEVLLHLPRLLSRLFAAKRALRENPPDMVVTIDAPDFMFRLHKVGRQLGIPVVHWVAPSVWAWRPGRARTLAKKIDHLLTLFPFEPPFFTQYGLETTYVGHPMSQDPALQPPSPAELQEFRARYSLEKESPLLCVLLGSRQKEWEYHAPVFGKALRLLRENGQPFQVILPTLPGREQEIRQRTRSWSQVCALVTSPREKGLAFHAAAAAMAVSGTVTLELAYTGVPTVVAYRTDRLSAFCARRLLRTRFVALPNILLQQPVFPELLQERCTAHQLAQTLHEILAPVRNESIRQALRQIPVSLRPPEMSAATVVERLLGRT
ncbi:MAG: lipid-A-disaccharide synthase [Holosporales bacterium]|nr:lipid-A-disaccharide synthase [Holosporales bacterium]